MFWFWSVLTDDLNFPCCIHHASFPLIPAFSLREKGNFIAFFEDQSFNGSFQRWIF